MLWPTSFRCVALLAGVIALAAAMLLAAGGCQQPDVAERRLAMRRAHLQRIADVAADHERQSAGRLEHTLGAIGQALGRDAQASRDNVSDLGEYWHAEWRRWIERQPAYQKGANRFLGGQPEQLERSTVILLF